jgi:ferredoxin
MMDKIQSVKLICFSPTGTTRTIIQHIAGGIGHDSIELIDITQPEARKRTLQTQGNELLVVGIPVYMGRVPALVTEWLHTIQADQTPVVCVVVYGNRTYDNALFELKDILTECGCRMIAGAAYIGEHSFSSPEIPVAHGRPDVRDLDHAALFGHKIKEKLQSVSHVSFISNIDAPGSYPYGGVTQLWNVDFITVSDQCIQCGACVAVCPVAAINPENVRCIDEIKCITCCACIKSCVQNARIMKAGPVMDAAKRLNQLYYNRKEPVFYF